MNRRRFVFGSLTAAAAGAVLPSDAWSSPMRGGKVDAYTIPVRYATTQFGERVLRTRTYAGRTYGPVMTTRPGHLLRVRIVNELPSNRPADLPGEPLEIPFPKDANDMYPVATRLSASKIDPMNNPHEFNSTNLHVHGVQTIPHLFQPLGTSNPHAKMIAIRPGESYRYDFPIPADHPSGLYWYHPHLHGSTDVQVSGGMAGLLVIRGPVDDVPEIAAAREIFLVVQSLQVNATPNKPDHFELEPIPYESPKKGGYNLHTDYVMFTVNGQGVTWLDHTTGRDGTYTTLPPPEFTMRPGEVVRLRMLTGTNVIVLPLVLPGMDVYQIGVDGVNFLEPALLKQTGTTMVTPANVFDGSTILASSGNRNELLIRAPQTPGTYTLSAAANDGISVNPYPRLDLAKFVVSGTPVHMEIPKRLPVPKREYPIITKQQVVRNRTVTFDTGTTTEILTGFSFTVNGQFYDEMTCSAFPKNGTAEEWTIEATSDMCGHPFHLHDNSFQVFEINGEPVDPPLICDTIFVPPKYNGKPGTVKMRVRFKGYKGKTVYHCHILPHEDTGMMSNILVT
ncbi:MAG TPA: multicopper oxidase domain-containing protein [Candidatus Rubrimentiphilum sp.]|nr:multicopper oxidase domain-containing protein [Candidatus Rubrimentiphilum sp.]